MSTREKLLAEIEAYLERTGLEAWRLGDEAVGDHTLVKRLRAGRDVNTGTADAVRAFMAENRTPRRSRPPDRQRCA